MAWNSSIEKILPSWEFCGQFWGVSGTLMAKNWSYGREGIYFVNLNC